MPQRYKVYEYPLVTQKCDSAFRNEKSHKSGLCEKVFNYEAARNPLYLL